MLQTRDNKILLVQLLSRALVIFSVLLLVIGVLQFVLMEQFLYDNKAMLLRSQLNSVPPEQWEQTTTSLFFAPKMPETSYAYVKEDGSLDVLFKASQAAEPPSLPEEAYQEAGAGQLNYRIVNNEEGGKLLVLLQQTPAGLLQVTSGVRPTQDVLVRQLMIYVALSALALVVGRVALRPVLKRALVPLPAGASPLDPRKPGKQKPEEAVRPSAAFPAIENRMAPGRLDFVVRGMEAQLRFLAGTRHVELPQPFEGIAVFDQDRIKQVILYLFQNAVLHTDPQAGEIRISLERSGDGIQLAVCDNGPGLAPEHLPLDNGLAITQGIIELHGGTIRCESRPGRGTSFQVWLPASE